MILLKHEPTEKLESRLRDLYNCVCDIRYCSMDDLKAYDATSSELKRRGIEIHVESKLVIKNPNKMSKYRLSWAECAPDNHDEFHHVIHTKDIDAHTPAQALLLWAHKFVGVEEIHDAPENLKELQQLDLQAFYSKSDGKFNFTELKTSNKKLSR